MSEAITCWHWCVDIAMFIISLSLLKYWRSTTVKRATNPDLLGHVQYPYACVCVCVCTAVWASVCHLWGQVPVEDALTVQVLQPTGDVQGQAEPHAPRQVDVAAQQLLQVSTINELCPQSKHTNTALVLVKYTGYVRYTQQLLTRQWLDWWHGTRFEL